MPALQIEPISYVVFQVRDETAEDIQRNLALALDVILDSDGFIEGLMSSVASAVFNKQSRSIEQAMESLLGKLGSNIRAVYGQGRYLRGTVGSRRRFAYGTVFPGFGGMLESLLEVEFGSSRQL